MRKSYLRLLLPALLLLLAACGSSLPRDVEPDITQIDTDAVVATVAAGIAPPETRPAGSPDLSTDLDLLVQAVVATLEPRLAENTQAGTSAAILAAQNGLEADLIDLYRRANPATVYIITALGSGSGFVYDAQGHIVTNNHVVENGRSYEIVFANGERRPGRLIGRDVDSDLAVLQVDDLPAAVEPLPLAGAEDIQVGQFVIAIGNPFGEQGSMSLGIVSGLDRSLRSQRGQTAAGGGYSLPEVIQTDAPINPGNSGGPLLNLNGEVVGVNSAIATASGTNSGVGFSVPVAAVHRIVPNLIESGGHEYAYLGASFAEDLSLAAQEVYNLPQTQGAYVLGVTAGGPAAQAGIAAADINSGRGGDLIVEIDGRPINDFSDLNSYLVFNTAPDQTIKVKVLRGNRPVELDVRLGARP